MHRPTIWRSLVPGTGVGERARLAGFERVRRGLDLGDMGLPAGLGKDLVVVGSGCAVDEFPDDVGVSCVSLSIADHVRSACAQARW